MCDCYAVTRGWIFWFVLWQETGLNSCSEYQSHFITLLTRRPTPSATHRRHTCVNMPSFFSILTHETDRDRD